MVYIDVDIHQLIELLIKMLDNVISCQIVVTYKNTYRPK